VLLGGSYVIARTLIALVIAGTIVGSAFAFSNDTRPHNCQKLLPKGGGTVVHGVFVRLDPGEFLKLCTYEDR